MGCAGSERGEATRRDRCPSGRRRPRLAQGARAVGPDDARAVPGRGGSSRPPDAPWSLSVDGEVANGHAGVFGATSRVACQSLLTAAVVVCDEARDRGRLGDVGRVDRAGPADLGREQPDRRRRRRGRSARRRGRRRGHRRRRATRAGPRRPRCRSHRRPCLRRWRPRPRRGARHRCRCPSRVPGRPCRA